MAPECLLLMQVGAFMQVMGEDARAVAEVTGLKLQVAGDVDARPLADFVKRYSRLETEHKIMKSNLLSRRPFLALLAGLVTVLLSTVMAVGAVALADAWGWGTNVGWINLGPANDEVVVCADHLEGYAWGENVGWIRLGTFTGCGAHTYANTSNTDYGVNRDGANNLSGFAWGTNVGWINFDPANGGVSVDPSTGKLVGYAWGENVGWIRFDPATA